MSCVAVIDFGKTNVKVALVETAQLREVEVRRITNTVRPEPPYAHYDTEGHWRFIVEALRELGTHCEIGAISITTHGATAALVDADGGLVLPILDYEHDGPDALAAEYEAARPPFEETGSPRLAAGLNLGAQLFWQFHTFPEARATAHILTYPQYWAHRLCGTPAAELTSLGCHTDLWSPCSGGFSSLVARMGWTELFPDVRRSADILGTLRPEIARETGLRRETPVLCGIHDSNASLYPHLLQREGAFTVVSTGTWVIAMAIRGGNVALDPERDTLVNVNALGEPVPSARFMGGREYEIVRAAGCEAPTAEDRGRVLDGAVMLLPSVEPTTGPYRGMPHVWTSQPGTPGERSLALSWYLAQMTDTCLGMIGAEGPVIVEGPFARNSDFVEMLRRGAGRSVATAEGSVTGTSIGAALLADAASGAASSNAPEPEATDPELARYAADWRARADERSRPHAAGPGLGPAPPRVPFRP